jgi:phosphate-selective porin OprO/OprP
MRRPFTAAVVLLSAVLASAEEAKPKHKEAEPGWTLKPFALDNERAGFHVGLTGYAQADFRSYRNWTAGDGAADLRYPGSEWRRVRIGIEGRWRRLQFQLDGAPVLDAGNELKDAWLDLRIVRALRVRAGHQKVAGGPEWLTSPSKTDFLERAVAVDALSPDRDWGVQLLGDLGHVAEYQVGVFAGDGSKRSNRAGTTGAGRLTLKPAAWLELAGSASVGQVEAGAAGPGLDPKAKGFRQTSLVGWDYYDAVHVDGRRLRWGTDALVHSGPVSFRAEYLEEGEARRGQGPTLEDLPAVRGNGFSFTATWLLTGEKKTRTIRPYRPLFGGPGAVELAARYEEARADDVENDGFEGFGSRARNVRRAAYRAFTGGLNWWPAPMLRLTGNLLVERYDDALRAPELERSGNYVSLVARVQVMLP